MAFSSKGSTALIAKLRAMYGKRLTPQNYRELLRKQSVSEIAAYIKQQTDYSGELHDINENSVHRGQLENMLRRHLFGEYNKVLHYVSPNESKFFDFFILRMELDEILSCVRFLNAGQEGEYFFSLPSYFAERSSFDLFGLAKVKNYDELIILLKNTPYADILRKFDPSSNDSLEMIRIEIEFNKFYYSLVLRVIRDNFTGFTREKLRNSFGVEADLYNISEIIRLKKYFNAKGDYIRTLLLPYYCKIKKADLTRMIDAPDVEATMQVLGETRYGSYFTQNNDDYIEHYSQQIMYAYHKKLLNFSDSSAVSVVAYLQLERAEINNLISIIEGVRYGLSPADIGKLLIGSTD
jgi:V/A-type H+-transporting ATPase subunit C